MTEQTMTVGERRRRTALIAIGIAVTALLAAAVVTLSILLSMSVKDKNAANTRLKGYWFEALGELSDEVDETVLNLSKLTLSLSKGATESELTDLSKHSHCAANALARLPMDGQNTQSAMKLLNQITDYAASYSNALARGLDTEGYVKNAVQFKNAAEVLQARIDEMAVRSARSGEVIFEGFSPATDNFGSEVNEQEPDYPEMIYDGPFSDGRLPSDFKGLEAFEEISESEALYRFEQLLGVEGASVVGMSSEPAAYEIEGGGKYAALSVKGGMFLEMSLPPENLGEENLTEEDAYVKAEEYAAKLGYGDLTPVWYYSENSVAFVNMTPTADGAILYTDLVKVKLSLTDGTLLGIEATGYCRNHIDRAIEPKISESTAAKLSGIDYDSVRLCVIPDRETEAVCYEVHGYKEDMEFYLYVDAVTGEKVKAMKVVGSGGGKLTA